jgi:N-methylhydantoinase A/oxoprolinase/acetone carboxylase beta subunit
VATNGLQQRRGATVGLLHTAGFGHTLFISRAWKAFGLLTEAATGLSSRSRCTIRTR